mmetsp:Transcript_33857/g.101035  ORF Transcript_33857/g.101035 Transcript_33857/m.101035 type:complete len:116 (-) Transcript_33857:3460-3807(-)
MRKVLQLKLSKVMLVSELTHHVCNTVFDVAEHPAEVHFQSTVFTMGLLQVVVRDKAKLSKTHNTIFKFIATLRALVLTESLLLRNDHFIYTLVQGWSNITVLVCRRDGQVHLVLL